MPSLAALAGSSLASSRGREAIRVLPLRIPDRAWFRLACPEIHAGFLGGVAFETRMQFTVAEVHRFQKMLSQWNHLWVAARVSGTRAISKIVGYPRVFTYAIIRIFRLIKHCY